MNVDLQDAQIVDRQALLLLDLSWEETGVVTATHGTRHSMTGLKPGRQTFTMDAVATKTKSAGVRIGNFIETHSTLTVITSRGRSAADVIGNR